MNSLLKGFVVFLFSIQLISCAKEFRNPYDPATPPDIWMPKSFRLDTLGNNTLLLSWNQEEQHIDGFAIQKSTNGQIKEILLPLDSLRYTDIQAVDTSSDEVCPELSYKVMARAGNNRSLDIGTTSGIRMPLSTPAIAGSDIIITDTSTTIQLNAQAPNSGERGQWSIISGSGGAFSNLNAHNSNFTGSPCTEYVLRWTKTGCTETFDEVNVKFQKAITIASAGANQTFFDGTTQINLNANNLGAGETGIWTIVSGTGGVLENPSSPNSLFTGQSCTNYVLRWTISDVCNSSFDEMNVNFQEATTFANAGENQTITNNATQVTMAANATTSGETGTWTVVSGTGGVFSNSNSPTSIFTGNTCSSYTLRWTIQGQCSSSFDEVVISFSQSNTIANAGADQTIISNANQVTLAANSPAAGETGSWTILSGVGGSFSNPNSPTSTFIGNPCSSYTLRWTIGACNANYDEVSINLQQAVSQAIAGVDQSFSSAITQTTLAGNAVLPGESGIWSVVSGTGGVFANSNSATTQFTGLSCQTYTLKWTKTSCSGSTSDNVNISFNQVVTIANAGADQVITTSSTQTTLDGNSLQTGETGLWTVVSGSGGVFSNAAIPNTVFSGIGCQSYTLKWTKTTCTGSVSDNVIISFQQVPAIANAGSDFTATSLTVSLAANSPGAGASGVWSIVSGIGGSFSNSTSPTSNFTGILGENYLMNWSITTCGFTSTDQMVLSYPTSIINGNGVIDIDGNNYTTQIIGGQEWMSENLKTTRYCNGDLIPNITDNSEWIGLSTGAWCLFDNSTQNDAVYGKLYNGFAVIDDRNLCPCGWHVPSDDEWSTLTTLLGGIAVSGGKLKTSGTIEAGTGLWLSPNEGATNESGFSALPGGIRVVNGSGFLLAENSGYWWSSSDSYQSSFDFSSLWARGLFFDSNTIARSFYEKGWGMSVRCVKD